MIEIPPSVVISWPTPDYEHPETKGPALVIIVLVFYTLAPTLRIGVREYLKRYHERFGDWKQRNESLSSLTHLKEK